MKKIFGLFLVLCIMLSLVACGGEKSSNFDLTEELIKEKWVNDETGDETINFYKTGTGRFESSMAQFDFTWEKLDDFENCIRLNYHFVIGGADNPLMTENSTDWELVIEDGIFHLNSVGEGYNYIRESDFKK